MEYTGTLRVWELESGGGSYWVVAENEEQCWRHVLDHHGDESLVAEHQEAGLHWQELPADKKISICLDECGDVCGVNDGTGVSLACWVWVAKEGAGFLAATE